MSKNTLTPQAIDSEKLQKLYDGSFPDVYLLVLYIWATTRENLSSWFAKYKGTDQPAQIDQRLWYSLFWKVSYINLS